ncbi:MAG: zinc-ribbon domain-containing protein [Candidatus Obscuribacterales bacterium]|nr:zinc-ribbon domain-containing protein [Candidatus Obscuribacterales bacterium]
MDHELNDKKPSEVTARCDYLAYWQCQKNIQHVYQASINDRTRTDGRGSGCPLCRKESTGLGQFPEVLKYFDRKRNKGIDPLSLPVAKKIWWKCSVANDHVWSAALWTHSNEKTLTCPYCAGRKASSTNNLTLSPLLNAEYDRAKNKLPANKVTLISKKQVGWICSICKHKWETSPNLRYKKEYGCPECAHKKRSLRLLKKTWL